MVESIDYTNMGPVSGLGGTHRGQTNTTHKSAPQPLWKCPPLPFWYRPFRKLNWTEGGPELISCNRHWHTRVQMMLPTHRARLHGTVGVGGGWGEGGQRRGRERVWWWGGGAQHLFLQGPFSGRREMLSSGLFVSRPGEPYTDSKAH